MSNSTVCHIEYESADLAESQRFGEQAFGWTFRSFGDDMIVYGTPEGHIGGFVKGDRSTGVTKPEVHYSVDSIDSFVAKAVSLGAKETAEKREVPGVGYYASITAPDGNHFGLVEFTK